MAKSEQRLRGQRIVVTGSADHGGRLAGRLRALGAEVVELPLIRVVPDVDVEAAKEVFAEIGQYEWIVFTSANGVRHFFDVFFRQFEDIRALGLMRVAAVGEGTAEAIRGLRLKVDVVPEKAVAEELGEALAAEQTLDNVRILVVTGNRNRDALLKRLGEERAIVDTLRVYRSETTDLSKHPAAGDFRERGADALVFASASAVTAFGEQAAHLALKKGAKVPLLCSFGPVTSRRMAEAKIPVAVEASTPGVDAMAEALVAKLGG